MDDLTILNVVMKQCESCFLVDTYRPMIRRKYFEENTFPARLMECELHEQTDRFSAISLAYRFGITDGDTESRFSPRQINIYKASIANKMLIGKCHE